MGDVKLAVEKRDRSGKGPSRRLRSAGRAPGVVYGGGREASAIAFDPNVFDKLLETSHGGINTLIDLEGDSPAAGRTVIAKDVQRHPLKGHLIHVDFYEVDLKQKIQVSVPVHLLGEPQGVVMGGVLDQQIREVELLCLPGAIPDDLQADVTALDLGDSLHVRDLAVPKGVEIETDGDLAVAAVLVPRGLKDTDAAHEDEDQAEAEGEASAEEETSEASDESSED